MKPLLLISFFIVGLNCLAQNPLCNKLGFFTVNYTDTLPGKINEQDSLSGKVTQYQVALLNSNYRQWKSLEGTLNHGERIGEWIDYGLYDSIINTFCMQTGPSRIINYGVDTISISPAFASEQTTYFINDSSIIIFKIDKRFDTFYSKYDGSNCVVWSESGELKKTYVDRKQYEFSFMILEAEKNTDDIREKLKIITAPNKK